VKNAAVEGFAELRAAIAAAERRIDDIVSDAALAPQRKPKPLRLCRFKAQSNKTSAYSGAGMKIFCPICSRFQSTFGLAAMTCCCVMAFIPLLLKAAL
jgi:hypothetical protein